MPQDRSCLCWGVQEMADAHASSRPDSCGDRYPTLATLPSGNVLIVGGSIIESGGYYGNTSQYNNPTYQVYSPTQKTATPSLVLQQLVMPAS